MGTLQKSLEQSIAKVPHRLLANLIATKLQEQGIKVPKSIPAKIVEHILSGHTEPFKFGTARDHRSIRLAISKDETEEISRSYANFLENKLPAFTSDLAHRLAKAILKDLKSKWPEQQSWQRMQIVGFQERLEGRWSDPLNGLRMLLTVAREWGQDAHKPKKLRRAKNKLQREMLLRLHVRACQVTDEIICLLENGFADGAMARWRTLHELAVVAAVISRHGEAIARRYLDHQAIESRRAMNKYNNSSTLLGYRPLPEKSVRRIERSYKSAIARYGTDFDADFGWATLHLQKKRVTFADLEAEAGRADMRSYYQMGNDNVHAGVKSLFVRLGLMDNFDGLLSGRSNAGLTEPGQNAAHTLTQLSVLVCLTEATFDNIVIADVMRLLRNQIPTSFFRAERRLRQDEKGFKALEAENHSKLKRHGAPTK